MKFSDFQISMSQKRIDRYLVAMNGDTRKAMTLYRYNLRLSQELFTIVICLEIALRNKIYAHYTALKGIDWLRDAALTGGMYAGKTYGKTPFIIQAGLRKLPEYSPHKLIAEMEFGFWRYLFAKHQFFAGGQSLLGIFPSKPSSTRDIQYNNTFVFGELEKINCLRNRIAHHEPICFQIGSAFKDTFYARSHYDLVRQFFRWMQIDETALLYGLDHIRKVCDTIDDL